MSRSEAEVRSAKGSRIAGKENVSVGAEENLALKGSSLSGKNVRLEAGRDLTLEAAENTLERETSSSTRSAGAGVTLGVGKNHAGIGYDLYGNQGRENEKESRMTYEGSTVKAQEQLHTVSGRDTLLTGSRMEGRQVQVEAGRNLRLESLQDRETYASRNTGGGISVSAGGGHVSGSGSAQKQILRSDYESVTEQAGIYAGDQGFQIQAGGNTHLKGAVIHSDAPAEKNRLETGTLSWEDVENRASYKADGQGVAFSATTRTGQEDRRKLNERGLYPEVVSTVKGRAESTTKAGISAGSIIVREGEKQIQPVKQLNRDTKNSLQKLATIFDKEKVQEKQELVNELSKVGNRAIHELAARKGWQEGSDEQILAHSIFGGLLSSLAGGKIATGTLAGGVGEYVNGRILAAKGKAWVEKHPDLVQAISAAVGSAVGAVTGESSIGSNVSLGGTKWNDEAFDLNSKEIAFITFLLGLTQQDNLIINASNEVIAEWNNGIGWLSQNGEKIDELGGEEYTREVKKQTGKSKADLYWNPKTGNVYSVPKHGGEAEWVDKVDVD
ncbi:hemagglutinin repeat-containing protein [Acidaminococcus timonensis]|uniref:hemagglutinin repeat-containing protein n=1 Tax=Acidaminococcus timonensis TaxID=1871002 RepID=UPI0022875049|nr:hemagglutinin repeat-containing protein [Acidaminococcus timonensis]